MAVKKIPIRKCVGCGEGKPKRDLIRIVRNVDGEIGVDLTGKKNGRGAYICRNTDCLLKAQKSKRLERAFSCAIPKPVYDRLFEEICEDEK